MVRQPYRRKVGRKPARIRIHIQPESSMFRAAPTPAPSPSPATQRLVESLHRQGQASFARLVRSVQVLPDNALVSNILADVINWSAITRSFAEVNKWSAAANVITNMQDVITFSAAASTFADAQEALASSAAAAASTFADAQEALASSAAASAFVGIHEMVSRDTFARASAVMADATAHQSTVIEAAVRATMASQSVTMIASAPQLSGRTSTSRSVDTVRTVTVSQPKQSSAGNAVVHMGHLQADSVKLGDVAGRDINSVNISQATYNITLNIYIGAPGKGTDDKV